MSDRAPVDIRAELQRLAAQREAALQGRLDRLRGMPMHAVPPSGRGGDVVGNRPEDK